MDPTSPVHDDTVLPDRANGGNHAARQVTRLTGWISTIVLLLLFLMLSEIAFSTYSLISLSNRVSDNARTASLQSCGDGNEVRKEFLAFIDSSLGRSERAATALIESPAATPDQKAVAARNLAGLKQFLRDAHASTKPVPCVYPPLTTTTISSRPTH